VSLTIYFAVGKIENKKVRIRTLKRKRFMGRFVGFRDYGIKQSCFPIIQSIQIQTKRRKENEKNNDN